MAVSGLLLAHFCKSSLSSAEEDWFGDGLIRKVTCISAY